MPVGAYGVVFSAERSGTSKGVDSDEAVEYLAPDVLVVEERVMPGTLEVPDGTSAVGILGDV